MDMTPAVATLRGECPQEEHFLRPLLGQFFAEKGIHPDLVPFLASQPPHFLGALFGHLMMQSPHACKLACRLQQSLASLASLPTPHYQGSRAQNRQIDAAVEESQLPREGIRCMTWLGAAGAYLSGGLTVPASIRQTRILIVGAGAAGLLATRALRNAGFGNLLIMDKQGQTGGVWQRDALKEAPMAVPFPLHFEQVHLQAAPRPGSEVADFLQTLATPPAHTAMLPLPPMTKAEVTHIMPGDLHHRVIYLDETGNEHEIAVPIVINALGVGEPLPPSREGWMTTDVLAEEAGLRWQEVWSLEHARRYHGRTLVFISLSNATLEMLRQIHAFQRQGLRISYKVLSHYPTPALADPLARVEHRGKEYRLYRDLERFNLLRVAGDLRHVAEAFEQARDTHNIIPQVTHWAREGEEVVTRDEHGDVYRIPCDALYTLIGYGPKAEQLGNMGLSVNNPYLGAIDLDWDGEAQRADRIGQTGRERIWPGYFCLGQRNAFNPNEVLLPGLIYRLTHLVAGVILRSVEWALTSQRATRH